jgi:glycosyltransferase involved in cell wall biosynthesis
MKSLEIDIPVYNEEVDLPKNIPVLFDFFNQTLTNYNWKIVIVNNASTDQTQRVSGELLRRYPKKIEVLNLDRKGRGWALRNAWKKSSADYVSYMDIDLSSDINCFKKMVELLDAGYDLVTGSRNLKESKVIGRTWLRELMSRTYITLVRLTNNTKLSDTQCGFKALRRESFMRIEPLIQNNLWFFDTETVILMEKTGAKVTDIPIKWIDDRHTTVKIARDSWEEFSGLVRLWKTKPWKLITTP